MTAHDILVSAPNELEDALGVAVEAMAEDSAGQQIAGENGFSRLFRAQIASAVEGILSALGIEEILVGGWIQLLELQSALVETEQSGGDRFVALSSHTITSEHSPSVEMTVNGTRQKLLDLGIALNFTISACDLVVANGVIRDVELGSVTASGELKASGRTLLKRETGRLESGRIFGKR